MSQCIYLFVSFIYRLRRSCDLRITHLLGLVLVGLRLAGRTTWSLSSANWQLPQRKCIVYVFVQGWHVSNFSENVDVVLILLVIVVQVQYVTQFSKYEHCCQFICRSRESSLIPNCSPDSGSGVMGNPVLWLAEMHSGFVANVSDWVGWINLPQSLVGDTTFECPFENTSERNLTTWVQTQPIPFQGMA